MIKQCICKTCGRSFLGGPRAWYCHDCRAERKKETNKRHKLKKKLGETRLLGSVDKCTYCKKEYIVEGGNQVMCSDCKQVVYAEHDRKTSIEFYHEHKEKINPVRNKRRRIGKRNCVICGKEYESHTSTITCSESCKRERTNQINRKNYHKNKDSSPHSTE